MRINDQGKTNVPGIWACGDVTGKHMLAHVATREGIVAVNNMFGRAGPDPLRRHPGRHLHPPRGRRRRVAPKRS